MHISVEVCQLCEAGFRCIHSVRYQCDLMSSTSQLGSTQCNCRPGYVLQQNLSCGSCPPNSICPGGNEAAVTCNSRTSVLVRNDSNKFCPCPAGSILNSATQRCLTCNANFYCPAFPNMTGGAPSRTVYAR